MAIMITGTVMVNISVHETTTKRENKKASDNRKSRKRNGPFLRADIHIAATFISQIPIVCAAV